MKIKTAKEYERDEVVWINELMESKSQTLRYVDYEAIHQAWKNRYMGDITSSGIYGFIFFGLGLFAVWANFLTIAVLLIAIAAYFNQKSQDTNILMAIAIMQKTMAMYMHGQATDIEEIRQQVLKKDKSTIA